MGCATEAGKERVRVYYVSPRPLLFDGWYLIVLTCRSFFVLLFSIAASIALTTAIVSKSRDVTLKAAAVVAAIVGQVPWLWAMSKWRISRLRKTAPLRMKRIAAISSRPDILERAPHRYCEYILWIASSPRSAYRRIASNMRRMPAGTVICIRRTRPGSFWLRSTRSYPHDADLFYDPNTNRYVNPKPSSVAFEPIAIHDIDGLCSLQVSTLQSQGNSLDDDKNPIANRMRTAARAMRLASPRTDHSYGLTVLLIIGFAISQNFRLFIVVVGAIAVVNILLSRRTSAWLAPGMIALRKNALLFGGDKAAIFRPHNSTLLVNSLDGRLILNKDDRTVQLAGLAGTAHAVVEAWQSTARSPTSEEIYSFLGIDAVRPGRTGA